MFERLIEIDKSLFLILNGLHNQFFDNLMVVLSARLPWIPLYVAILLFIFFSFKWEVIDNYSKPSFVIVRKPVYNGLVVIAGILLTFAFTDIISTQIKHLVERPRPCYDPVIGDMVRMLEYKGGRFGFFSSHAANVFGLATLTSLFFRKRYYSFVIFFWAAMVSYSRIYVGKHYPLDVICGAVFGILLGLAGYLTVKYIIKRITLKSQ